MTSIGLRVMNGLSGALITSPFMAGSGALIGYIYSKFADLPVGQVCKAWAVWRIAETAVLTIAMNYTENYKYQGWIRVAILHASTFIGLRELIKRELIGPKMLIAVLILHMVSIGILYIKNALLSAKDANLSLEKEILSLRQKSLTTLSLPQHLHAKQNPPQIDSRATNGQHHSAQNEG